MLKEIKETHQWKKTLNLESWASVWDSIVTDQSSCFWIWVGSQSREGEWDQDLNSTATRNINREIPQYSKTGLQLFLELLTQVEVGQHLFEDPQNTTHT
jgi:hypothetical protein